MEKLKKCAEPIMVAATKAEEEKKNGIFKNYPKSFLLEYEEIRSYELTRYLFEDYSKYEQIMKEATYTNQ